MDDMGGKQNENLRTAVPFIRQITQDGKPKLEVYRPTTNPIYINTQVRFYTLFLAFYFGKFQQPNKIVRFTEKNILAM